jgi:hypothetical protein
MTEGKHKTMNGILKKALAFMSIAVIALCFFIYANSRFHSNISSRLTPWTAVGGCGSSAGSASGDVQIKWIGTGVMGALFDCEVVASGGALSDTSFVRGSEYDGMLRIKSTTALVSLFYHPPRIMDIKLSMPFLYKEGNFATTSGFGDLLVDLNRKWGVSGNIASGLSLIIPTGFSSIMASGKEPLSSDYQLGGGLFSASLRGSYTFDFDWGIINLGGTYSAGLFAIRTTEYNFDADPNRIVLTSKQKQFEFARESWGARNDAGVFSPDYLGIFTDFGIKQERYTHGFCATISYPTTQGNAELRDVNITNSTSLATKGEAQAYLDTSNSVTHGNVTNIALNQNGDGSWNFLTKTPTPRKTPTSMTLQYSIEKTDMLFPILVGGIVKLEYANRFNFAGFSFGVGFKFPVY